MNETGIGTTIPSAGDIGKEEIRSVKIMSDNEPATLKAILYELQPRNWFISGEHLNIELLVMAKRDDIKGLEKNGYYMRKKRFNKDRKDGQPYTIIELWEKQEPA